MDKWYSGNVISLTQPNGSAWYRSELKSLTGGWLAQENGKFTVLLPNKELKTYYTNKMKEL